MTALRFVLLLSPSAQNCARLLACAQYTDGKTASCSINVLSWRDRDAKHPPSPFRALLPFTASRKACTCGRELGHEAGAPHLLLQPGAIVPSALGPETYGATVPTSSRAPHGDSSPLLWFLFLLFSWLTCIYIFFRKEMCMLIVLSSHISGLFFIIPL